MDTKSKEIIDTDHINNKVDKYKLTRNLGKILRGQTLWNPDIFCDVANHTFNCLVLADFLNFNGYISPAISRLDMSDLKNCLLYHDIHEIISGDIPYHIIKDLKEVEEELNGEITSAFIMAYWKTNFGVSEVGFIVDKLELMITLGEKIQFSSGLERTRLVNCYNNCVSIINKINDKNGFFYKVDFQRFLKEVYEYDNKIE